MAMCFCPPQLLLKSPWQGSLHCSLSTSASSLKKNPQKHSDANNRPAKGNPFEAQCVTHMLGTIAGCSSYLCLSCLRGSVLSKQPMYNPVDDLKGSEGYVNTEWIVQASNHGRQMNPASARWIKLVGVNWKFTAVEAVSICRVACSINEHHSFTNSFTRCSVSACYAASMRPHIAYFGEHQIQGLWSIAFQLRPLWYSWEQK